MRYIDFAQVKTRAATGEPPSIIITTPRVDWDRDRAIPERLRMAPEVPVLWAHDYQDLPVGRSVSSTLNPDGSRRAWFRWLQNDERANGIRNAFEQGFLSASIGVRGDWAEPNEFGGHDFGGDIIEFSLCSVPANPDCVRQLKSMGIWKREAAKNGQREVEVSMSAVEVEYNAMDLKHTAVKMVEDTYDALGIRGPMGSVPPRPNFNAMDADYRPPETRGSAGLSEAQRAVFAAQRRFAETGGVGPARSHGINLSSPTFEVSESDLQQVLRSLRLKLRQMVEDAMRKAQPGIDRALTRARGRAD